MTFAVEGDAIAVFLHGGGDSDFDVTALKNVYFLCVVRDGDGLFDLKAAIPVGLFVHFGKQAVLEYTLVQELVVGG